MLLRFNLELDFSKKGAQEPFDFTMTARTASLLAGTEVIIFSYPQPQVSVAVLHYTMFL